MLVGDEVTEQLACQLGGQLCYDASAAQWRREGRVLLFDCGGCGGPRRDGDGTAVCDDVVHQLDWEGDARVEGGQLNVTHDEVKDMSQAALGQVALFKNRCHVGLRAPAV